MTFVREAERTISVDSVVSVDFKATPNQPCLDQGQHELEQGASDPLPSLPVYSTDQGSGWQWPPTSPRGRNEDEALGGRCRRPERQVRESTIRVF